MTGTCELCGGERRVLSELPDKTGELRVAERLGGRRIERLCWDCWREQMDKFGKEELLELLSQAMIEIEDRGVEKEELDGELGDVKKQFSDAEDEIAALKDKVDGMFDEAAVEARADKAEKRGYNEGYDAGWSDGSEGSAERGADVRENLE